jgi:hypothetical protein
LSDSIKEWTEADGTIYRLNSEGNYDVIPPAKKAKKPAKKQSKKKVADE